MTLKEYIASRRGNGVRLAQHLGCGVSYVSQLASGHRTASPSTARKIETFTDGQVQRQTLVPNNWQEIWPELVSEAS